MINAIEGIDVDKKGCIEQKTFAFAKSIVRLVLSMKNTEIRYTIGRQLLRSGTSIGANVEEAEGGISKRDFIHSMNIAKKEARETKYWLCLIHDLQLADSEKTHECIESCKELLKILTAIVKTAQNK